MKTTTIETTGFDALGIQTTTTTTTQFQVANVGFANMLNNQFRDWDSCEVGNFLISPSISFNDNGNIKKSQFVYHHNEYITLDGNIEAGCALLQYYLNF